MITNVYLALIFIFFRKNTADRMASYSRSIITFLLVLLFMVVVAATVLAGEYRYQSEYLLF